MEQIERNVKAGTISVDVETNGLDEAVEKVGELSELVSEVAPQIVIRNSRDCTFNISIWRGQE